MYDFVGADHWARTTVFELARWKNGLAFKNINFTAEGRPVIKIAELKAGITDQTKFTNAEYNSDVRVQQGDMLFSWSGNPDTSIDVFRWDGPVGWLNQHIYKVYPSENVDDEFLFFLLRSLRPRFAEIARNKQTTGLGHVTLGDFKQMVVGLPTKVEQKSIVAAVGPIEQKIELNRRMNETLEMQARALFRDWFVDFGPVKAKMVRDAPYLAPSLWSLFPDRLDDYGLPEGWRKGLLADVSELQNGYAFRSGDWRSEGVPVIKIGSIKPRIVDLSGSSFVDEGLAAEQQKFALDAGDMLVGLTGYVGETGRVPPSAKRPMLNQRVGRFRPKPERSSYVFSCVRDTMFKEFSISKSHGSAQANVSTKDLLSFPINVASPNLMRAFETSTRDLWALSLSLVSEADTLAQTRDLLLPKLMSGEMRVGEIAL